MQFASYQNEYRKCRLLKPRDILIEKVAGELAATWFEAAQNTPEMNTLRKKYRNDPRRYARMNLEKFIPKAVETLISCLQSPRLSVEAKEEIYNAILDRTNDPENLTSTELIANGGILPKVEIKPILDATNKPVDRIAQMMDREVHKHLPTILDNNPGKATRQ